MQEHSLDGIIRYLDKWADAMLPDFDIATTNALKRDSEFAVIIEHGAKAVLTSAGVTFVAGLFPHPVTYGAAVVIDGYVLLRQIANITWSVGAYRLQGLDVRRNPKLEIIATLAKAAGIAQERITHAVQVAMNGAVKYVLTPAIVAATPIFAHLVKNANAVDSWANIRAFLLALGSDALKLMRGFIVKLGGVSIPKGMVAVAGSMVATTLTIETLRLVVTSARLYYDEVALRFG